MEMETIADLQNQTTSSEPNNANSVGNAGEQELVKEEDGALDMMDALELHCLLKHQDYCLITDLIYLFLYLRFVC